MKKIVSIILCAVMLLTATFALTSCQAKGKTLAEVQEAGKLVVATSPDFPPFENLEGTEVVGIEIDIIKLICQELGVELELVQIPFDSVLPGVQRAKYDVGVSGITVTPDREKNTLFSDVYYIAAQSIVVRADSDIDSKDDLAGKKISVQSGTTAEDFCLEEKYNVDSYESNPEAKIALTSGKVEAWVVDNLTAIQMCKADSSVKILDESMTEEPYAFAFCFGSEDLVEAINEALNKLIDNGTVAEIFAKYGEDYMAP